MGFAKRLASVAGAIAYLGAALVGIVIAAAPVVITLAGIAMLASGGSGGGSVSLSSSTSGSKRGFFSTMGSFISSSLNKSADLAKFALTGKHPALAAPKFEPPRMGRGSF